MSKDKNIPTALLNDTFAYLEGQPYRDVKALLDRWYEVFKKEVPVEPVTEDLKE